MGQVMCSYCSGSGRDAVSGAGTCIMCNGLGMEWVADDPNQDGGRVRQPRRTANPRPRTFSSFPRKERNRRKAKLRAIVKSVSIRDYFGGQVNTYLTDTGEPLVDDNGDFTVEQVIPRKEHLNRLEALYRNLYQTRLETLEEREHTDELIHVVCWEARERLRLQSAGRYIAPIDANGFKWTPRWFRTEKRLFGQKTIANKHWKVKISAYDKRCRLFISQAYGMGRGYTTFEVDGVEAADLPAVETLLVFINSPTTNDGPIPDKLK